MKKTTTLLSTVILGLVLITGLTGCKHRAIGTTEIPGVKPGTIGEKPGDNSGTVVNPPETTTGQTISDNAKLQQLLLNGKHDREKFAADTVHFDTDSATIKKGDRKKLENVAAYFKGNSTDGLLIEGHCDERGTEQYNISLGDKRALAVREYLANLGVDASMIHPQSFGEAKPADPGHDESAWKKNRRAEFILLTPQ